MTKTNLRGIYDTIFECACNHFPSVIKTLTAIERLNQPTLGLEGWFRIELVKSLENTTIVKRICNRGADLLLENGDYLELKAGADLNFNYILQGAKETHCLFLGKPRSKKIIYDKEKIIAEFQRRVPALDIKLQQLKDNWYIGFVINQ